MLCNCESNSNGSSLVCPLATGCDRDKHTLSFAPGKESLHMEAELGHSKQRDGVHARLVHAGDAAATAAARGCTRTAVSQ